MMKADILFFDVDGTLVDARSDIVNSINYALKAAGADTRSFDELVSFVGTGVKDLIRRSLGTSHLDKFDDTLKIFSGYYSKHAADEAILYPNVVGTLEYFKNKRKLILTNRYSAFADIVLKKLGIRRYFEEIIGGDDENCLKPSACILDPVFGRLKVDRKDALIIGDMAIDVETGKNAHVRTCFVTYGLGKREDLEGITPDVIIDDIAELKRIVK